MSDADLITEFDPLRRRQDGWRREAERLGNAFVTPEWFFAWWRHYGDGFAPAVVAAAGEGAEAGVLPLVVAKSGRPRAVRFGGSNLGDSFEPASTDARSALAAAAGEALAGMRSAWGAVVLDNVELGDGAEWWRGIADGFGGRLRVVEQGRSALPYIPIAGLTWDDYLAGRSPSFRKRLRQIERGLDRAASIRLRRTESAHELEADLAALFALHGRRWEGRGTSALAEPRVRAFHEQFAAAALERGWLRLWLLEADGEPIAAWYGWCLGGRYAFYQSGFDPAWSRQSVGLYIVARVIEQAIAEGAQEFNMLLGTEAYKSRFAELARPVCTVVMTRPLHPASLLVGAEVGARRAARRLSGGPGTRRHRILGSIASRLPTGRRA